jgi:hypothetical protein
VREGGDWFARFGLWRFGVPVWCVMRLMPVWERDVADWLVC